MKTLQQIYNGFFLDTTCANARISNCKRFLRVAPIKKTDYYNGIQIDKKNFVFAEKNYNGDIEYFHGLKNFLWVENQNFPPIFIFDNHNHAITFRYYIIYSKNFINTNLIHIDQHSDCRGNENHLEINKWENELEKVFLFGNEKCNVGNFIPPAIKCGLISDQIQIRSTTALQNLKIDKNQNFILDIDLDFCLDGVSKDKVNPENVKLLKSTFHKVGKSALGITIATSPYFLNQDLAISILDTLFS